MHFKFKVVFFILSFSFIQTLSCNNNDEGNKQGEVKEIFNIDGKVELLFFYKKEATYGQRKYFDENILMRNSDRGHYMRDGVKAVFGIDRNGYQGFGITFSPNATKEQREDMKARLKDSELVYKIYENVVPNEINDLPGEKKPEPNKTSDVRPAKEPKAIDRE